MEQHDTKPRQPPAIVATRQNRFYWEGATQRRLLCQHCTSCGWYMHPPLPICSKCHSTDVEPAPMSGRGSIYAFTVVRRVFHAGFAQEVPYLLALVALAEQPALHVLSRIVDCELDAASIGMAVCVTFAPHGDWQLPVFRPERIR
jgi:uncharacterized OB-fold protein